MSFHAVAALCVLAGMIGRAAAQEPRTYIAQFTESPPLIDGLETTPDEWAGATAGGDQWLLLSGGSPDATNNRFDVLWDQAGLYLRHRVDHSAWQLVGTDGWAFNYEQVNYFFDPNTDDEPNGNSEVFGTSVDGYQLAFNMPLGTSQIDADLRTAGMYTEAHVNSLFGNQGGPFSQFAGIQMMQNTSVDEAFGYTELFIPWDNFDATDPEDGFNPETDDVGLYHPEPPQAGDEWYFNVTRIQSNGLIPAWSSPPGVFFMADRPHGILRFEGGGDPHACDLNGDSLCDAADIDALSIAIFSSSTAPQFDINGNGTVEDADRYMFIEVVLNTWVGDSNLDGQFSTRDLVEVFSVGGYEDGVAGNAGWAGGDWNGDLDFTSRDFVEALSRGGFEVGPRAAVAGAVHAVPEPSALVLFGIGLIALSRRRRP